MEMFKEKAKPDSQAENVLSQGEAEEIQKLSQGEEKEYEELPAWGFENYQEALQGTEERVYELFQRELERYQEVSQWGEESVQELPQCNSPRLQELSQLEGETVQEVLPGVDGKVQEPCQWEGKSGEELSQAEDNSDQGLWQWEGSMEEEPSEGEVIVEAEMSEGEVRVRGDSELCQERDNLEQEVWQEDGEHISIHTIWVNPKYPELLQKPQPVPQRSAQAAACPAWWEEEAGAESPGPAPHSPCCPPSPSAACPEGAVAGAEVAGPQIEQWSLAREEQVCKYITIHTIWVNPKYPELLRKPPPAPHDWALAASSPGSTEQVPEAGAESQVPRKRPSRCRRLLRALRRLLCMPCLAGRPED